MITLIFILDLRCSFAGAELQAARCLPSVAPQTLDWRFTTEAAACCRNASTVSFLPACSGPCVAGEQLLGYLYSALYDAGLQEVGTSMPLVSQAHSRAAGVHNMAHVRPAGAHVCRPATRPSLARERLHAVGHVLFQPS